jgi:hypothetical protein
VDRAVVVVVDAALELEPGLAQVQVRERPQQVRRPDKPPRARAAVVDAALVAVVAPEALELPMSPLQDSPMEQ